MASPPTAQYVRDLSLSGEFNAIADAVIEGIRDSDVVPVYNATDLQNHTQWAQAVALHTAHILHVQLKWEAAGGNWNILAGVSSRALQGVGSRGYAVGALNPGDAVDIMKIPSIYLARLTRILGTFPPSMHGTGSEGAAIAVPISL